MIEFGLHYFYVESGESLLRPERSADGEIEFAEEDRELFEKWVKAVKEGTNRNFVGRTKVGESAKSFLIVPIKVENFRLHCLGVDVTETERDRYYFQNLFDAFNGFLFAKELNSEGNFEFAFVNAAIRKQFRGATSNLIGKTDFDVHNPEESSYFQADDHWVLKKNGPRVVREESFTPAGSEKPLSLSTKKVGGRSYDFRPAVFGSSFDISDIVSELDEVKSLFSEAISTANPVSAVCSKLARKLLRDFKHEESFEGVAIIRYNESESQFEMISKFPIRFWDQKETKWDSRANSVCRHVITHGEFDCGNFDLSPNEVRPIHPSIKATVAVRVRVRDPDFDNDGFPMGDHGFPWGVIACVSEKSKSPYELARARRRLAKEANYISLLIQLSHILEENQRATARFFSVFLEVHELDTQFTMASNYLRSINEIVSEIEDTVQTLSIDVQDRISQDLQRLRESAVVAEENIDYLTNWHKAAQILSEFIEKRFRIGFDAAVEFTREKANKIIGSSAAPRVRDLLDQATKRYSQDIIVHHNSDDSFIRVYAPLVIAAVRNLIDNAIRAAKGSQVTMISDSLGGVRSRGMRIVVSNPVTDASDFTGIKKLQMFFAGKNISPASCPGWGSSVILLAAWVHRGSVSVMVDEDKKRVEFCVEFSNI